MSPVLRIGTRGSPLALAQAHETRTRLIEADPGLDQPGAIEVVVFKTTGDRILDRTLAEAGGKGLFTKELDDALDSGAIDLAVHSMKDVPTWIPQSLIIACLLPREDPRDAWFSRGGQGLDQLPAGSVVGTASLRRQAQVLGRRPDLKVVPLRGNVGTRLAKLAAGTVDATLLAVAGLRRLGFPALPTTIMAPEVMLPAVAQGAIGIATRRADWATRERLRPLHCPGTANQVAAERGLLAVLDGSCRTPIAALARLEAEGRIILDAQVLRPDGRECFRAFRIGAEREAEALGRDAGEELKALLPADFFGPDPSR